MPAAAQHRRTGNGTAVASAKAFADEFSQKLKADGVDAVILTST